MFKDQYYERFFDIFEAVILDCVKPRMVLTLTGGWDTRTIGGILALNGVTLPSVCYGTRFERSIASKIAATLGFPHYSGANSPIIYGLAQKGFEYLLTGSFFDEINGSWSAHWADNFQDFLIAQEKGMKRRFPSIFNYAQLVARDHLPRLVMPILTKEVIASLAAIPWRYRIDKQIQRWILKTKFPELWRIPYYNSMLPCFLPYPLHMVGIAAKRHNMVTVLLVAYRLLRRTIRQSRWYEN